MLAARVCGKQNPLHQCEAEALSSLLSDLGETWCDCLLRQTAVPAAWLPLTNTFGAVWEGSNLGGMPPYDLQISSPSAAVNAP